jgi:hypothetical protein
MILSKNIKNFKKDEKIIVYEVCDDEILKK